MSTENKGFMYGLDELKFNGTSLGYIEKDSFDWGGQKGEVADINAEQKKGYPVFKIPQSNGTVNPTFDLIEMKFENMAAVMGGEVTKTGSKVTGWKAPSKISMITGEITIDTDSGHRITIPNCLLSPYISGGLNLTSVSKIKCELGIMEPSDGGAPFTIDEIPASGGSGSGG